MRFMKLADEYSGDDSEFTIIPVEYEKNLTYGDGASKGPAEIIKASEHLEYYDEQFNMEPFENGIKTLETLKPTTPEDMVEQVSSAVSGKKFPFVLGGDHAVTIGALKGIEEDASVIILDAHSDFFHSWNGSELNHRCVAKRASSNRKVLLLGVRSMDADEAKLINDDGNVQIIKAYDYDLDKLKQALGGLNEKVYVSIDSDVFDISFLKNTGTPEPGGFMWNQVIEILKTIFESKKVVGADIVEFAPKENFDAEAFALAKLTYKIMALAKKYI